jgi:hypothetical protein
MAHAPKGAKVPKKRGLLGYVDSTALKRGAQMTPTPGSPAVRRGQKFSLWHEFLTSGLLAVITSDASTPPRGAKSLPEDELDRFTTPEGVGRQIRPGP